MKREDDDGAVTKKHNVLTDNKALGIGWVNNEFIQCCNKIKIAIMIATIIGWSGDLLFLGPL